MTKYKELIQELTISQAKEILSITAKSIKEKKGGEIPLANNGELQNNALDVLAKPILIILTEGEDDIAASLQQQLIKNEDFLKKQRAQGDNRSISLSMLPILAIAIPFIEAKFELKIGGQNQKFHLSARLKSLQEVLPILANSKFKPLTLSEESPSSMSVILKFKKSIEQLIGEGKTSKVIAELMEYFDDKEEDIYQELLILSGQFNTLKRQKRTGTINHDDFKLASNKISVALLDFLPKLK